jgi:hypothetical protein
MVRQKMKECGWQETAREIQITRRIEGEKDRDSEKMKITTK